MRVAFAVYDFRGARLPLQPWLTVARVAQGLRRRGHDVHVISDVPDPAELPDVEVHQVESLRGTNNAEVAERLRAIRPDAVVSLPTPLNVATTPWLRGGGARRVGFASYPFYTVPELWRGLRSLGWRQSREYLRHALVPGGIFKSACSRTFDAVVAQSQTTCARLRRMCPGPDSRFIPPGIDLEQWPHRSGHVPTSGAVELLYLGSAIAVRGFDVLLRAMTRLRDTETRLTVMARGASAAEVERIQGTLRGLGLEERVTVRGGWSDREDLIRAIHQATAVVLPFVLVPSELPVTVMEVIACGTPVIGSRIDGLPSAIGPAGTAVAQGSDRELAAAIRQLHASPELLAQWQAGCLAQRTSMLSWDQVVDAWERVLHG